MPNYSHFQAESELMQAAMSGEVTRIPVYAQMHDFAAAQLRISSRIFYTQPEIMVPALLQIQSDFGLDVASITYDVYNIEAEGLGQNLIFSDDTMPDIDRRQPLIRDCSDLASIETPDFDSVGRFTRVIEMQSLYRRLTGIEPTLSFCAPFTLAANLYGIENLLIGILTEPELVGNLFCRLTDQVLAPWIMYQNKAFPNATKISGADAIASLPIVSPAILKQWVIPYILRLRKLCGSGVYVSNWVGEHCLHDPAEMLDLKLTVGPGSILGQDPDVEALTPGFYKQYAARRDVPLILGIGASFLAQSKPEDIVERVQNYVQVGKVGGRFALYICNIGATTPPENVRACIEAAHSVP